MFPNWSQKYVQTVTSWKSLTIFLLFSGLYKLKVLAKF